MDSKGSEGKLLLDREDVMFMLNIGNTSLYNLIHSGQLKSTRLGRKLVFRRADVEEFVRRLSEEGYIPLSQ